MISEDGARPYRDSVWKRGSAGTATSRLDALTERQTRADRCEIKNASGANT